MEWSPPRMIGVAFFLRTAATAVSIPWKVLSTSPDVSTSPRSTMTVSCSRSTPSSVSGFLPRPVADARLGRLLLPELVIEQPALQPGNGIEERGQSREPADVIPVSGFARLRPEGPAVGRRPGCDPGLVVFLGLKEHGRCALAVPELMA